MMVNYMSDVAEEMSWKSGQDPSRTSPSTDCRPTALTSMPTKPSGTGPGKRSRPTNAWEQKPKSKKRCMYSSAG